MSVLSPALLGAVALVLLASATSHLRRPVALRSALVVHDVIPPALRTPVSLLLPVAELLIGAAALLAVTGLAGDPFTLGRATAGVALVLFAGFAAYLVAVLRTNPEPGVPCACGLGEAAVGPASVARAGVLALFAGLAALTADGWTVTGSPAAEILVAGAAALTLAVAAALLPAAREVPDELTLTDLSAPGGVR